MGRHPGALDKYWPDRMITLLGAVSSIQRERHTVSLRELETACGVSRQTIANWLEMAEAMGFVDLHDGQPRALELLPKGRKLVKRYEDAGGVKQWHAMREELRKQYANQ